MHAQRAASRASSCLSASNRDSVNVANLRVRHDTKAHTGLQRKGLCHNYTSLSSHSFPPPLTSAGRRESPCPTVGSQKKKLPLLRETKSSRPTEGGCHRANLRIASGAVRVKVKKREESTGSIYTAERGREGGRQRFEA